MFFPASVAIFEIVSALISIRNSAPAFAYHHRF